FDEKIWDVIKSNIKNIGEYEKWYEIINGSIKVDNSDQDFINLAESLLPPEPWGDSTWGDWIALIKESSDKKGKDLFLPIRKAITGLSDGPELKNIILLMGYDKMKKRLLGS
ncbi:MAG: glutamate--tRNA ligase, partial [Hyphomicrobiales bacterium]|nr:glutamate--tRNA ligase [Hyphomicrobiales bacterium]